MTSRRLRERVQPQLGVPVSGEDRARITDASADSSRLGAADHADDEGTLLHERQQVLDEPQRRVVKSMSVVEEQAHRSFVSGRLQQTPHAAVDLGTQRVALKLAGQRVACFRLTWCKQGGEITRDIDCVSIEEPPDRCLDRANYRRRFRPVHDAARRAKHACDRAITTRIENGRTRMPLDLRGSQRPCFGDEMRLADARIAEDEKYVTQTRL